MANFPIFTDLRTLSDELREQPEFARLNSRIDKALRTQSCLADLREAHGCLAALDELLPSPRRRGTELRHSTEAALFRSSVTLYERATSAAGKRGERGSIKILDDLTPDQLADHAAIVSLRQRSIAHVYSGETVNGTTWHSDHIFAVKLPEGWRAAAASHRIQFDETTFSIMKRQVPIATKIMALKFQDRLAELVATLNAAPVEEAAFLRHMFDPVSLFGGEAGAQAVLDGSISGSSSMFT